MGERTDHDSVRVDYLSGNSETVEKSVSNFVRMGVGNPCKMSFQFAHSTLLSISADLVPSEHKR